MVKVLIHGTGQKAAGWTETISCMKDQKDILCPDLHAILNGKDVTYENLYASLIEYCRTMDGPFHLCGLSLGGILALNYTLDFPERVRTLVLIGTPHEIPKAALGFQNVIFRLLPRSAFRDMAFDKKDTFGLINSMKQLDFKERLQEITCPVLVLCGEKDRVNRKSALYFSQNIENAALGVIENAGHAVNEENPKALAKILGEYYMEGNGGGLL